MNNFCQYEMKNEIIPYVIRCLIYYFKKQSYLYLEFKYNLS